MQTFLPYRKLDQCARVLDNKRLGKQRVETMQLMKVLVSLNVPEHRITTTTIPWSHHPAALMWSGYEVMLMAYQSAICDEWDRRGFNDTCRDKTRLLLREFPEEHRYKAKLPEWWGLKKLHSSHRANLLRKDPEHYGQFGWKEEPIEGYWWPTQEGFKVR